jgi:hypothetical protein
MSGYFRIASILAVALLAGCSTGPRRSLPAPVVGSGSQTGAATGVETAPATEMPDFRPLPKATDPGTAASSSPAVVALLSGAERKRAGGEFDAAVAALERALRIEPRNALLWHRLALIRFEQKRYTQAMDLAARSNSLPHADARLREANRALIQRAKARSAGR